MTEHKRHKLVFNSANQKVGNFFDELQKLTKYAFETGAHANVEQFIYSKMPPHLKKSISQAHLQNCTCEQIVLHPKKELELNCLKAPEELHVSTVSQHPTNTNQNLKTQTNVPPPWKTRTKQKSVSPIGMNRKEQAENAQVKHGNKNSAVFYVASFLSAQCFSMTQFNAIEDIFVESSGLLF